MSGSGLAPEAWAWGACLGVHLDERACGVKAIMQRAPRVRASSRRFRCGAHAHANQGEVIQDKDLSLSGQKCRHFGEWRKKMGQGGDLRSGNLLKWIGAIGATAV